MTAAAVRPAVAHTVCPAGVQQYSVSKPLKAGESWMMRHHRMSGWGGHAPCCTTTNAARPSDNHHCTWGAARPRLAMTGATSRCFIHAARQPAAKWLWSDMRRLSGAPRLRVPQPTCAAPKGPSSGKRAAPVGLECFARWWSDPPSGDEKASRDGSISAAAGLCCPDRTSCGGVAQMMQSIQRTSAACSVPGLLWPVNRTVQSTVGSSRRAQSFNRAAGALQPTSLLACSWPGEPGTAAAGEVCALGPEPA